MRAGVHGDAGACMRVIRVPHWDTRSVWRQTAAHSAALLLPCAGRASVALSCNVRPRATEASLCVACTDLGGPAQIWGFDLCRPICDLIWGFSNPGPAQISHSTPTPPILSRPEFTPTACVRHHSNCAFEHALRLVNSGPTSCGARQALFCRATGSGVDMRAVLLSCAAVQVGVQRQLSRDRPRGSWLCVCKWKSHVNANVNTCVLG